MLERAAPALAEKRGFILMAEARTIPIPLVPGIRQDGERTLLPPGSLVHARNARRWRTGIGQRRSLVDLDLGYSGLCGGIGEVLGLPYVIADGRVYLRDAYSEDFVESGRASRALPVKTHWIAFDESTVSGPISLASVAATSAWVAVAYQVGTSLVRVVVMDGSGLRRLSITEEGSKPRIIAVGDKFIVAFAQPSSGLAVRVFTISASLVVSSVVSQATRIDATDAFDICPFGADWLLATRTGNAEQMTVTWYDANLAHVYAGSATRTSEAMTDVSVYGDPAAGIWVAFNNNGNVTLAAYPPDLLALGGTDDLGVYQPGRITRFTTRDATTAWAITEQQSAGPPVTWNTIVDAYDTNGSQVSGKFTRLHHVRLASRPFVGDLSTQRFCAWLHTDNGAASEAEALGAWSTQRRYTLASVAVESGTVSHPLIQPEFSPDDTALETIGDGCSAVAFRDVTDEYDNVNRHGYAVAFAVVRTQQDAQGTAALVLYEWQADTTPDAAARQVVAVGDSMLVLGGGVQELQLSRVVGEGTFDPNLTAQARGQENGFVYAPAILAAEAVTDTDNDLTPDALYQLCVTAERISPDGLRIRSAPSNIVAVTATGGHFAIQLTLARTPQSEGEVSSPPNATVLHVWSTVGDGNTFVRVTPDSGLGASVAQENSGTTTYIHQTADAEIEDNEPLYTEGGVLPNWPAPAHRFGWAAGSRVCLGGLLNPCEVELSKEKLPNEPLQFTRNRTHRALLPEAVTAGAWMDGVHVLFTRRGVYLLSGAGPDRTGAPALGQPQRVPSTVGCIDHRSVVEVPEGLIFQSPRGLELLPRGFGPPRLISEAVQDLIRGRRVVSTALTAHAGSQLDQANRLGERMLMLYVTGHQAADFGVRLAYDLDVGVWMSADSTLDGGVFSVGGETLGAWRGRLVVAARDGSDVYFDDPTHATGDEGDGELGFQITTADVRPFGPMGRGECHRLQVLGQLQFSATITLEVFVDGAYSTPINLGPRVLSGIGTGDKFVVEWPLREAHRLTALGFRFTVVPSGEAAPVAETVVLHSMLLEADSVAGRPRVGKTRRGG